MKVISSLLKNLWEEVTRCWSRLPLTVPSWLKRNGGSVALAIGTVLMGLLVLRAGAQYATESTERAAALLITGVLVGLAANAVQGWVSSANAFRQGAYTERAKVVRELVDIARRVRHEIIRISDAYRAELRRWRKIHLDYGEDKLGPTQRPIQIGTASDGAIYRQPSELDPEPNKLELLAPSMETIARLEGSLPLSANADIERFCPNAGLDELSEALLNRSFFERVFIANRGVDAVRRFNETISRLDLAKYQDAAAITKACTDAMHKLEADLCADLGFVPE